MITVHNDPFGIVIKEKNDKAPEASGDDWEVDFIIGRNY